MPQPQIGVKAPTANPQSTKFTFHEVSNRHYPVILVTKPDNLDSSDHVRCACRRLGLLAMPRLRVRAFVFWRKESRVVSAVGFEPTTYYRNANGLWNPKWRLSALGARTRVERNPNWRPSIHFAHGASRGHLPAFHRILRQSRLVPDGCPRGRCA